MKILTKPHILLFALLVLVVIGTACLFLMQNYSESEIRNVLLISIDTCRADRLGCYGYSRRTTPNIDALAAEAVLFTHAVAPVPLTLPSHSSMLTGTIPPYHRVHNNDNYRLGESNVTLAEVLSENGFATGAVIGAFVLDSQFGLAQGFETYNDSLKERNKRTLTSYNERTADEVTRLANNWLQEHFNERFFLFLHYFDPHIPYKPHKIPGPSSQKDLYDGEIVYTDQYIGKVIKKLKHLGLLLQRDMIISPAVYMTEFY